MQFFNTLIVWPLTEQQITVLLLREKGRKKYHKVGNLQTAFPQIIKRATTVGEMGRLEWGEGGGGTKLPEAFLSHNSK